MARTAGGDVSVPVPASPNAWRSAHAHRTYVSGALWLAALLLESVAEYGTAGSSFALAVAGALIGGANFFPAAWRALRARRLEMNVLMSIALLAAISIGEAVEAGTLAFLFSFAELLERASVARARHAITRLYELAPDTVEVVGADGTVVERPSSALVIGDVYRVRSAGRFAADGIVRRGESSVDEATITGESMPVLKVPGAAVLAGTLNQEGALEIEVTRAAGESALARIIRALRVAEANRAPSERAVQRFAAIYTPTVTLLAIAVAVIPAALGVADAGEWFLRGVTLLVIACPCALVVATPVSVVSAIAGAARRGLLVRGGAPLEALAAVRAFAMDKTGTITTGRMAVENTIVEPRESEREMLSRLAAIESRAEHPVARAIVEYVATLGIAPAQVTEGFAMSPGLGVSATVDGVTIRAGRDRFVPDAAARFGPPPQGRIQVLVSDGSGALAVLTLTDTIRADAAGFLRALHDLGISPVVMLTGDSEATARDVAGRVGIDDVRAGLLPEGKVEAVRDLRERHGRIAMIGDGVNDAPALATADVGLVMGVAGAPATIETADVALMSDDLAAIPRAIRLARGTVRTIRFNIAIALLTKVLLAVGTVFGVVSLSLAVLLGDVGATVLVTVNAMRLARAKTS